MTADNDIVERLRALSHCEHSDLSVGDEAAAEIVRLRGEVPAGEAVAWMHGVCADDGEEDQALSFSPDNFPLEGVAGYRKVWCRPLIYGDTHPPAAEVREVDRG